MLSSHFAVCLAKNSFVTTLTSQQGYYIEIPDFKLWPMKMLSGPIGVIWHFDPNKPLWSLMAKAWSTIRDQVGKDSAPLDRFFDIICPYLNIPPPHKYLPKLGWNLVTNDKGVPTIERDPSAPLHACDVGAETTALSTEDLIKHCLSKGYAPQYIHEQSLTSSTFLGHNLTITETAKRLVAKKKRRAQRQVGRDTGFAADLQDRMLHANTFDNPKIAEDGNVHHVMRDTADALDNEDALNTFLHEQLASAFPGAMTGISSDAEFYPQNTAVSTSYDASLANSDWNGNPFRAGADPLATLSNDESKINNWFNDDQSYSPSGAL
jgi:hypothetical protein